jgi:p-methyltransferase
MGKREHYFDVINRAIQEATGRASALHFAWIPNVAAYLLASFLERNGLHAEVINYFDGQLEDLKRLLAEKPRLVAITTTFYIENGPIKRIVAFLRRHAPDIKIVVGGPRMFHIFHDSQPSAWKVQLEDLGADFYVNDSQGELTLLQLARELASASPDLAAVPNLVYLDRGELVQSARTPEDNDMNRLSVSWRRYLRAVAPSASTVSTRTARSCAFRCAFCRYPLIAGDLNLADVAVVERELDELEESGARYVMFIDDTFNIPEKRFQELCRMMIQRRSRLRWFSYFRCANAHDASFDLMAEAGCVGVFLGIESGDRSVLRAMNKAATPERYLEGIGKLRDRDIITYATFIAGHPGETEQTIQNTIDFIRTARPTFYSMEPYYHDPKVPIAEKTELYGIRRRGYSWSHNSMDWRRATEWSQIAYETITESIVLPLNNFDLWSIGYLMGQGLQRDCIIEAMRILADILVKGLRDPDRDFAADERKLIELFAATDGGRQPLLEDRHMAARGV